MSLLPNWIWDSWCTLQSVNLEVHLSAVPACTGWDEVHPGQVAGPLDHFCSVNTLDSKNLWGISQLGHSLTLTGKAVGCEGISVQWLPLKLKVMWQNWSKNYGLPLKQWLLKKNIFVQSEKHSDMIPFMSRWGSLGSLGLNNMYSFSFDLLIGGAPCSH